MPVHICRIRKQREQGWGVMGGAQDGPISVAFILQLSFWVPKVPQSLKNSAASWRPRVPTRDHVAGVGGGSLFHIQSIAVVFPETGIIRASGFGVFPEEQENPVFGDKQDLGVPPPPLDLLSVLAQ